MTSVLTQPKAVFHLIIVIHAAFPIKTFQTNFLSLHYVYICVPTCNAYLPNSPIIYSENRIIWNLCLHHTRKRISRFMFTCDEDY